MQNTRIKTHTTPRRIPTLLPANSRAWETRGSPGALVKDFTAVTRDQRRENAVGAVGHKPHRAVGQGEVGAAVVQAPEVSLVTVIIDIPRLQSEFDTRALAAER